MANWRTLYRNGSFAKSDSIFNYLMSWRSRFFLFDEIHPFMQVADLDLNEYKQDGALKKDKTDGLMRLVREAPDKGGRTLFDHRVGTIRPEYEPRQIVRMIVSAQSFSGTGIASGGKIGDRQISPTPCQFAPCVEGLVLWLQGENLFQTLLLNCTPSDQLDNDKPPWEDESIIEKAIASWRKPIAFAGPVQRFAPLSRFIRVLDHQSMFFTNGLKPNKDFDDPMKVYMRPDDHSEYQVLKLHKDRAAWRDSHALFEVSSSMWKAPSCLNHAARLDQGRLLPKETQPMINIVGLATNQGKALLWRHDRMPLPLKILGAYDFKERLDSLILEAEYAGERLSSGLFWNASSKKVIRKEPVGIIQLIADLVVSPSLELRGPGVLRTKEGRAPEEAHNKAVLELSKSIDPCPAYWARLEKHFFALLEHLPDDWDTEGDNWKPEDQQKATNAWRRHVKNEAKRALEESIRSLGTTARAIQAIARVRTGFSDDDLKPPSQKVSGEKRRVKGGKTG